MSALFQALPTQFPEEPYFYGSIPDEKRQNVFDAIIELKYLKTSPGSDGYGLLGYPRREQEYSLQFECERLRTGYAYPLKDSQCSKITAGAIEWELLAEFPLYDDKFWLTPPDPGVITVWEESDGYLSFWIRKSDLAKADFSQICFHWDFS